MDINKRSSLSDLVLPICSLVSISMIVICSSPLIFYGQNIEKDLLNWNYHPVENKIKFEDFCGDESYNQRI